MTAALMPHYVSRAGTGVGSQHVFRQQSRSTSRLQSCRWRSRRCRAIKDNPQNVPDPKILPSIELGPEETVRVQLEALKNNNEPWPNHGIQTAYEFGEDIGGMERSRYFGYSKDLYHFDHFLGQFQNAFPLLVSLSEYNIEHVEEMPDGSFKVQAHVEKAGKRVQLQFDLVRKDIGRKKGALMTKKLVVV